MDRSRLRGYAAAPSDEDHQQAWADWLKEDSPLSDLATPPPGPPIDTPAQSLPPVVPAVATPAPDVTIELKLPKFKAPKVNLRPVAKAAMVTAKTSRQRLLKPSKKLALTGVSGVFIVVAAYLGLHQLSNDHSHQQAAAAAAVVSKNLVNTKSVLSTPTFQPLVPKSESALATPKAGVSAFDGSRDSYTFLDSFQQGKLQVSEQPLPTQFKNSAEAVAKVATSMDATATVNTAYGSAFIATQAKSNAQTVVFATDKLLIFIQSPFTYDSLKYQQYINDLQ